MIGGGGAMAGESATADRHGKARSARPRMNAQPTTPRPWDLTNPQVLLATGFGIGLLPWAPGTWASLTALPAAWAIHKLAGPLGLATAAVVACVVGVWVAEFCVRRAGDEDPGAIVIDEIAGQWLVLLAVSPDPLLYGIGFALFRAADIWKPWPVSWADNRIKGGIGVMLDDVLAAIYAGLVLYVIAHWIGA